MSSRILEPQVTKNNLVLFAGRKTAVVEADASVVGDKLRAATGGSFLWI